MSVNPTASNENKGCNPLSPLLSPPQPECVHAGGDSEPPLAPLRGGERCKLPIGEGFQLSPLIQPLPSDFKAPIEVIPGQTRILLSEAASRHLDATGAECFAIVSKAKTPDVVGRWVIHLVPCSMSIARAAEAVLMGKAKAVRAKPSKPTPAAPLTPREIRNA